MRPSVPTSDPQGTHYSDFYHHRLILPVLELHTAYGMCSLNLASLAQYFSEIHPSDIVHSSILLYSIPWYGHTTYLFVLL